MLLGVEMKSEFLTPLRLESLDDGTWRLLEPLNYNSQIYNGTIIVSKKFTTDLASVPRLPFIYNLWGNRAHYESVLHDWLYQTYLVRKPIADKIFLEAMKVRKKPLWIREPMYLAVKFGGGSSYDSGPSRNKLLNP